VKNTTNSLAPELQAFASLLDAQPPEVQDAFQPLLATAMHEGGNPRFGKFELLNVAEVDGRWHYTQQVPAILWHNYGQRRDALW
jgi:hypothetical protein